MHRPTAPTRAGRGAGFDVRALEYPAWLRALLADEGIAHDVLPRVVRPGDAVPSAPARNGAARGRRRGRRGRAV
jgi:hypothetical protein